MTRSDDQRVGTRQIRRRLRAGRVLAWITLVCAIVLAFEFILYTTALTLFTHLDTPECAGSDTFCSPDGMPGMTGGAVVVVVGNIVAAAIGVTLLVVLRRSAHARS